MAITTWNEDNIKCFFFFHKWGGWELTSGVKGINCEKVRFCSRCGGHQLKDSPETIKPWNIPDNEFGRKYKENFGDIVNYKV